MMEIYIARQHNPTIMRGAITDIFHWHVMLLKPHDNKVEVLKYTYFNIENEDKLLLQQETHSSASIILSEVSPSVDTNTDNVSSATGNSPVSLCELYNKFKGS